MTTVYGSAVGNSALYKNDSKVKSIRPIGPQSSTFSERTQGSVFNGTGQFGALTHNSSVPRNANAGRQTPRGAQQNSQPIGNLLAGNFGSITAQRNGAERNGLMANPQMQHTQRNMDQDHTKTSDQMLEEANNLTMKDMWAAA